MGIVNVTPDSFSGDGLGGDLSAVMRTAEQMLADGADILDVGGESTRPGAEPVSADEELRRVGPVVEALARRFDAPISVDTSKAEVADRALQHGAAMVNDVWGLDLHERLCGLVARSGAWVVLMHNRAAAARRDELGGYYDDVRYDDVVIEVGRRLDQALDRAVSLGIRRERIILDPGLGFGKTYRQNLELIRRLPELRALGRPLLAGASRKSFTGRAQGLPVDQRLETSLAVLTLLIAGGADLIRVHDVKASVRAARMADEVLRADRSS